MEARAKILGASSRLVPFVNREGLLHFTRLTNISKSMTPLIYKVGTDNAVSERSLQAGDHGLALLKPMPFLIYAYTRTGNTTQMIKLPAAPLFSEGAKIAAVRVVSCFIF